MTTFRRLNFQATDILNVRIQCQICLCRVDIPMAAASTIRFPSECPLCGARWNREEEAAMASLRAMRRSADVRENIIVSFELESPFEDGAIHDEFDFQ